jgi:hypothetical protein
VLLNIARLLLTQGWANGSDVRTQDRLGYCDPLITLARDIRQPRCCNGRGEQRQVKNSHRRLQRRTIQLDHRLLNWFEEQLH